jgi:hypothetical protein
MKKETHEPVTSTKSQSQPFSKKGQNKPPPPSSSSDNTSDSSRSNSSSDSEWEEWSKQSHTKERRHLVKGKKNQKRFKSLDPLASDRKRIFDLSIYGPEVDTAASPPISKERTCRSSTQQQ